MTMARWIGLTFAGASLIALGFYIYASCSQVGATAYIAHVFKIAGC